MTFERLAVEAGPGALAEASALYTGDFLEGFVVDEAPFEDWLQNERERLRETAMEVLAKLLARQMTGEALQPAIQTALRLLALDPLQEPTHRTLMRLYARQGRRAAALRQYQLCVDVLRRELGAEPDATTRQLYQQILPEEAAGLTVSEPAGSPKTRHHRPGGRRRAGSRATLDAPLIGRAAELDRLRQVLHDTRRRRGAAAIIVGEAGVGKTRLVEEAHALATRRGIRTLSGRAYESAQVLPFGLWVDALRPDVAGGHAALKSFDAVWRTELGRLFPELNTSDPPATPDDPLRLFEAITRFIGHLADPEPLLLILEDLHWADEMSLRLLAFLGRRLATTRVVLLCTARDEYLADVSWLGKALADLRQHGDCLDLALRPLSRDDTATLVRSAAPTEAHGLPPEELEEHVWRVSEGNPFVALATVRLLSESAERDRPLAPHLPTPVRELVLAHLSRLSDRGRQLVGIASIVGREVDFPLLQRVAGLGDREAAEVVEELVRRRIFRGVGERLDFIHDRIREAALGQLLPLQRRLLHREVGTAIESVYAQNLEPHYAALALHHQEGEVFHKALPYLRQAAAQARTRFAYSQAASFLEQALHVLAHLPETRETIEQAIDVRCDLRMSLNPLADDRGMLEDLESARSLAERIGDRRRLNRALTYLGREHIDLGHYAEGIEIEQAAVAIAGELGDRSLAVAPTFYKALACWRRGDLRRVCDIVRDSMPSIDDGQRPDHHGLIGSSVVFYRTLLARCLGSLGHFDDAIAWGDDARRLAEAVGHPYSLFSAYMELGLLHLSRGAAGDAAGLLEKGLEVARSRDIRIYVDRTAATLAQAYALTGRANDARALLDMISGERSRIPQVRKSRNSCSTKAGSGTPSACSRVVSRKASRYSSSTRYSTACSASRGR